MLVLMMEAAAARKQEQKKRKQGQLPRWRDGDTLWAIGQGGWRSEDPPGDAVLLTPALMGPRTPAPRATQPPAASRSAQQPQEPDLARVLFELPHRRPGLKRRRPPQKTNRERRLGLYRIGDGRGRGKRPCIGISPVQTVQTVQTETTHKQGPKRGRTSVWTADANT